MKKMVKIIVIASVCAVFAAIVILGGLMIAAYGVTDNEKYLEGIAFAEGDGLKIMSYNIRNVHGESKPERNWSQRRAYVMQQIREEAPDILCLQEVKAMQIGFIVKNLEDYYGYVYKYRSDNYLTKEAVPIFYNKERFTLIESDSFWLSETPEKESVGWDAALEMICTYARLKDNRTGRELAVYSVHFDHVGIEAMKNGSAMVLSRMARDGVPAVMLGDYNIIEHTELYDYIAARLVDTKYAAAHSMNSVTYNNYGGEESSVIDYIMHNGGFDVDSYKVRNELFDGKYASDHFAVITEVRYR